MKFNNRSKSKQNTGNEEIEDTLVQEKYIVDLEDMVTLSQHSEVKSLFISIFHGREVTRFTPEQILSMLSNDWINVLAEEARRNFSIRLKSLHSEINVLAEEARRNFSIRLKSLHSEINVLAEEARMNFINILKSLHSEINVLAEEARRNFRFRLKSIHSENTGHDENEDTVVHEKDNVDQKEKINVLTEEARRNFINRLKSIHSEINVLAEEARRNFINRLKSIHSERHKITEASEGSTNRPIHPVDRRTTYNSQEDNGIGMRGSMINENWCNVQDKQIPSSEVNTDISSDESWSTFKSRLIRLYENVIRNETSRMMSSIDMVRFEAEHLFGLERSRIFFYLLDQELCQFGSTGGISDFVPNMAESTVRQNVISFFEHAYDMMSRLMTLLLSCPDSKILQQMPVQNFISSMKSIIKSSLKAQTKGREKLSLEGNIYTMADPKDFESALGDEIPEDVLNRLGNGDEMVVHRFVDTRLERHQSSDREENRPIICIYFPSDCRLFIFLPTAHGSYWRHSEMRRADRIR